MNKEYLDNKCESCGAVLKKLSSNHYMCEYCGSEYFTSEEGEVTESKVTEKEILDIFYQAAAFEVKQKYWEELQHLLSYEDEITDNVIFYVKLGRAYRRNNMFAKAMECYEKAQSINPEYACIYSNKGAVYIQIGQFEKAELDCRKAIELMNRDRIQYSTDDYAVGHSNLAIAVGKQGRKNEAKQLLKLAEKNGYKNGDAVRKMIGIKKGLFS